MIPVPIKAPLAAAVVATLILAGCGGGAGPTVAPTAPPSATPASTPVAGSPAASGPCLDTGNLADTADPVVTVLQGLMADLAASNVTQAQADASTVEAGLKRLADLVQPVQPAAATDFTNAATELSQAAPTFPGGTSLVTQAKANLTAGLQLAGTVGCPS